MNYITEDFTEFDIYLRDVRKYKRLSFEEESTLWTRLEDDPEDLEASTKLVQSYLTIPIFLARKFTNRGLSFLDLIQEGNLGLVHAVRTYNASLGVKFITFAYTVIRRYIHRALAQKAKLIYVPLRVQKSVWKGLRDNTMTKEDQEAYSVFKVESLDESDIDEGAFSAFREDPNWHEIFDEIDTRRHAERVKRDLYGFLRKSDLQPSDVSIACFLYGLNGEDEHTLSETGEILGTSRQAIFIRHKLIARKIKTFKRTYIRYST